MRVANPGSGARNPGFDVTPAELITGIITPEGIFRPDNSGKTAGNWAGNGTARSKTELARGENKGMSFLDGGVAKW